MAKKIGVIPARMGSSRFPGKPMAEIHGMPMIGHVYLRSKMTNMLDEIYVATCDQEIFDYITNKLKGKAVMTSSKHDRATDRVAEAIAFIEKAEEVEVGLVVMIQGDEPMVTPLMIDTACKSFLKLENPTVLNLYAPLTSEEEFRDENEIKVVMDKNEKAIFFSREPIPNATRNLELKYAYKQVCIMPFHKSFLKLFNDLPPTTLEEIESIDMLRLLENDIPVYLSKSPDMSYSVDNLRDLEKVTDLMKYDSLMKEYLD